MASVVWVPIVVSLYCLTTVQGYADMSPLSACQDMQPGSEPGVVGLEGHLAPPQNFLPTYGNKKSPPFYMLLHKEELIYNAGEEISLSIVANQTLTILFYKGLMMQARRVVCASDLGLDNETIVVEDNPVGRFTTMTSSAIPLNTMQCGDVEHNTISHRSPQFKTNETVTWIAPETSAGHIIFRATILQEDDIYWTNLHSPVLVDVSMFEGPPTCSATRVDAHTLLLMLVTMVTLVS